MARCFPSGLQASPKKGFLALESHPSSRGRVPKLDYPASSIGSKSFSVRAPSHPVYRPIRIAPYIRWRLPCHLPNGDLCICASCDHLVAIRVPVKVIECGTLALDYSNQLPMRDIRYPQRPIIAAAQYATTIGRKGQTVYRRGMSLRDCPRMILSNLPKPDYPV
jgi:hypothetical protein